jgi:hypothetical protein
VELMHLIEAFFTYTAVGIITFFLIGAFFHMMDALIRYEDIRSLVAFIIGFTFVCAGVGYGIVEYLI